jgi:hypothetical protein
MHLSYSIGLLRGLAAFPLYASLIRDQRGAACTARPDRLPVSGRDGLRLFDVVTQPIGGTISKDHQALWRKRRERRKPLEPLTAVHAPSGGFSANRLPGRASVPTRSRRTFVDCRRATSAPPWGPPATGAWFSMLSKRGLGLGFGSGGRPPREAVRCFAVSPKGCSPVHSTGKRCRKPRKLRKPPANFVWWTASPTAVHALYGRLPAGRHQRQKNFQKTPMHTA